MASMNKEQRATQYLARIRSAKDPLEEARRILSELNTLVWPNNKPLTKQEKLEIVDAIQFQAFQTLRRNERVFEASDNSGILDVISLLKRGARD